MGRTALVFAWNRISIRTTRSCGYSISIYNYQDVFPYKPLEIPMKLEFLD